jgi:hypothetical protein
MEWACFYQSEWGKGREEFLIVQIIDCVEGHYEIQEVPFGKVYAWRSGWLVIECEYCGEVATLTENSTTCECGVEHVGVFQEAMDTGCLGDEELHPWRYAREPEGAGLPY